MNAHTTFKPFLAGLLGAAVGAASMLFAFGGPGAAVAPVAAVAAGENDQERIIQAVKHAGPSVVALEVTVNGTQVVPADPFGGLLGPGGSGRVAPFRRSASGSGFVYSSQGLIVTNDHVVHGASQVDVVFANGDRVRGHIFSEDAGVDLALVKVDNYAKLPPALEFGSSHQVQQGEWAIAIGEPLELKQTVTVGVVSGFNRDETIGGGPDGPHAFKGLLQTSAQINPGNSGGPLIDYDGRVIGVNQSVARPAQGIGFAIPADMARTTIAALAAHPGTQPTVASRGFIGVQLEALDDTVRQQLRYQGQGVAVVGVVGGSAADKAGLEPGDVIESVNGKAVTKPGDVASIVQQTAPGKRVSLSVWSGGTKRLVAVEVAAQPA